MLLPPGIRRKLGFSSFSFSMSSGRIPLALGAWVMYVSSPDAHTPPESFAQWAELTCSCKSEGRG